MRRWRVFIVSFLRLVAMLTVAVLVVGCLPDMECGDGVCDEYERNCPADCVLTCNNDGTCDPDEYPWNCPDDCFCGDGVCQGENCCTCRDDCTIDLLAADPCREYTLANMYCDVPGCGNGNCQPPSEFCGNCPEDCGSCEEYCGNGTCNVELGENCSTCPIDCHYGYPDVPCCGNTLCEPGEDTANCPCDCGGVPEDCQFPPPQGCTGAGVQAGEMCEDNADCTLQFPQSDLQYCVDCRCVALSCNGNGVCEGDLGENSASCPGDCGAQCGDGIYSPDLGEECDNSAPYEGAEELVCPFDHYCAANTCQCTPHSCFVDGHCDLLRESPVSCPDDCYCGDGVISYPWGLEECEADSDCPAGETCVDCMCESGAGACGDGTCDVATENTDLCPDDCPCVNDGVCSPGEGTGCADCGDLVDACGTPCDSSDDCREELSCFNAVCWDACICEGNCGGQESGGGTCGSPCTSWQDCGSDTCSCDNGCCSCP